MRRSSRFGLVFGAVLTIAVGSGGCSRSAQSFVDRGDAQLAQGNVDAAVLEYRNAVSKDPMFAAARQKLAEAYSRKGDVPAALGESVRAADLLPDDVEAQLKAGSLLLFAGRPEEAKARAEKVLAKAPGNVDALVLRANAMAGLRDLDGALKEMEQALSLEPRSSLQTNLGMIQAARGQRAEAEAAFRQAVATDAKSAKARVALGRYLWITGNLLGAEEEFKAALGVEPSNLSANRALAAFYLNSDRPAEAEQYFRKVVDVSGGVEAKLSLVNYFVRTRRSADAVSVLEELGKDARYWSLARARIADIYYAEGKKADAFKAANEVIAKYPSMAVARVVRGRLLLADGRIDEALADGQEAVRADPQSLEGHFLLGNVYEAKRELDNAARSFGEVLRLNPRAAAAQTRLAMIQLQRNELPAATQLAEQAAAAQPGSLAASLVLARSLVARGDLARAAEVTGGLLQRAPQVAGVQNQAGMLALARGDRAGARAAFEKALSLDANMVEPLSALVGLDIQEKKPAAARARLEQRLAKTPNAAPVLTLAGRVWGATGDAAKAEQFLRRAIEADGANLEAYSLLGSLYLSQQKPGQAIAEFDKLAARQPGAIGPATTAALILQLQGRTDEARARYERLVEANPRAAVAANNLAWIYASRGEQLDKALQLAQLAKAELPDDPQVNDTLAFVYLRKELWSLAIPPARLAADKEPANPTFHYRLGTAYAGAGDPAKARQELERALSLKPDFDGAADARALLAKLQR